MPVGQLLAVLGEHGIDLDTEQYATLYGVFQASRRSYQTYRPQPLPHEIDVLLFRATRSLAGAAQWPPDCGWNAVLPRAPRVHELDADHYSVLRGAAVEALAGALVLSNAMV